MMRFVLSLVGRCHGTCGSAKHIGKPVGSVAAYIGALAPGQRLPYQHGQSPDMVDEDVGGTVSAFPTGQGQNGAEPGLAIRQDQWPSIPLVPPLFPAVLL